MVGMRGRGRYGKEDRGFEVSQSVRVCRQKKSRNKGGFFVFFIFFGIIVQSAHSLRCQNSKWHEKARRKIESDSNESINNQVKKFIQITTVNAWFCWTVFGPDAWTRDGWGMWFCRFSSLLFIVFIFCIDCLRLEENKTIQTKIRLVFWSQLVHHHVCHIDIH